MIKVLEYVPELIPLGAVLLLHLAHDAAVRALHRQQPLLTQRAQLLDLLLVARAQAVAVRVRRHCALQKNVCLVSYSFYITQIFSIAYF